MLHLGSFFRNLEALEPQFGRQARMPLKTYIGRSGGLLRLLVVFGAVSLYIFGQDPPNRQNKQQRNSAPAESQSKPEAGRAMFESTCAACHGLDGRGGERGPDIATRQQVVQLSDTETLTVLRNGKVTAGMPAFDSLGGVQLKQLLAYLHTLQGKGEARAAALPGDAAKGKTLFFGKAGCSECHMVRGEGGFLGRELTSYGTAHSPAEIRSNIVAPGDNANHANRMFTVTLRDARRITGVIRNEDNFSIQLQSHDGAFHFVSRTDIASSEMLPDPVMPANYGKSLTPAELDDLVSYLVKEAGGKATVKREAEVEE
jgi:cytochrome c oxidase cbb3-type subunit 3